jgi:hypothetical protein
MDKDNYLTQAIEDILAERDKQVTVKGYSSEHDDDHFQGDLADAAACFALSGGGWCLTDCVEHWPPTWDRKHFKQKTPRQDLVRAAALLIAEIERLDRIQS